MSVRRGADRLNEAEREALAKIVGEDGVATDAYGLIICGVSAAGGTVKQLLVQDTTNPNLRVWLFDGASALRSDSLNSDGLAAGVTALRAATSISKYNGTSWDRARNKEEKTILASAARTGDTNSADITSYDCRGVVIHLNVSAVGAPAGQINGLLIQAKDPVSGNYLTIMSFATLAIASTGYRAFLIFPGAASAGAWTSAPLQSLVPRTWRIQVDHANETDSITYSLAVTEIN